ncbi:MAG: pyruvate carboxylase subunit B, partial [Dehalococcoidia bacterium]|nr:pyruvate carboxylase subunit B [Dehalococcoidia bacterium]
DLIKSELPKLKKEGQKLGILHREEDLITYALYPQVAVKFLRGEIREEVMPSPAEAPAKTSRAPDLPTEFSVDVDGEVFNIRVTSVLGKAIQVEEAKKPAELPAGAVVSPIQGMVLAVKARIGDRVNKGEVLLVIEAMKMQNQIVSPHAGVIKKILTFQGELVNAGDVLIVLEPEK